MHIDLTFIVQQPLPHQFQKSCLAQMLQTKQTWNADESETNYTDK